MGLDRRRRVRTSTRVHPLSPRFRSGPQISRRPITRSRAARDTDYRRIGEREERHIALVVECDRQHPGTPVFARLQDVELDAIVVG